MNSSPDSNAPQQPNSNSEIDAANEYVAQTPATLPLKRATPIFAEAVLTEEAAETQGSTTDATPPTEGVAGTPIDENQAPNSPVAEALMPEESVEESAVEPPSANTGSRVDFVPAPGPIFQGSVTLELRAEVPTAEIRYALNAEDVGIDGTIYNPADKIFLTQSASIATRVFVGGQAGPLCTAQFQIVQPAWQKIEPIDQSDATPHEIGEQIPLEGPWKLAAASTRGKLHAHRGLWREDSLAYGMANAADASWVITIVSDGAGSANLSRVGSKLLCAVALEHLQNGLTNIGPFASDDKTLIAQDLPRLRELLVAAASLALQKLREEADRRQRPLSDFSSTLLILVRREWNGAQLCGALQSGDGAIAALDNDSTVTFLGKADHGQHSSETKFLTTNGMEAELPARVKFSIRPRLRAAMVMSDGIADDFFPETVRFPELFAQVMPLVEADFAQSGNALLEWMRYEKKGSSDDRALIVSWRNVEMNAPIPDENAETVSAPQTSEEPADGEQ